MNTFIVTLKSLARRNLTDKQTSAALADVLSRMAATPVGDVNPVGTIFKSTYSVEQCRKIAGDDFIVEPLIPFYTC